MGTEEYELSHPIQEAQEETPTAPFLRMDRIPHIWCPGCGIGIVTKSFTEAVKKNNLDLDKVSVVSGIGCTGRVAGYLKLDGFHTTHGRPIPFATGLKLANPSLSVGVISGDGDLISIGGNHFIHAARRNIDITVVCINNYNYGMTGGQVAPSTPLGVNTSTSPFGNFDNPFNIPHLAASSGAVYVARWTVLDARRITKSIQEALNKKGFSLVEVIAPCPTLYGRKNKLGEAVDELDFYKQNSILKHGAPTEEVGIDFKGEVIVGKFVDIDKPSYEDLRDEILTKKLGDKYIKYQPENGKE